MLSPFLWTFWSSTGKRRLRQLLRLATAEAALAYCRANAAALLYLPNPARN